MNYNPTTWKSGDKVTSNKLNKIEQAIVNVDDELADVKEDLSVIKRVPIEMVHGYYIGLNVTTADLAHPVTAPTYDYAIVDCSEGDIFTINAYGGSAPRAYGFLDSSDNVIEVAPSTVTLTDYVVVAPSTAVKLVINDNTESTSYKNVSIGTITSNLVGLRPLVRPKYLTSADNLNNIITPGLYAYANSSSTPSNWPQSYAESSKLHGILRVDYFVGMGTNITIQTVTDYKNHVYVRRRNLSGVWSSWTEQASHSEITSVTSALNTRLSTAEGDIEDLQTTTASLSTIRPLPAKIFKRVGCIGDSYTKGYISQGETVADYPDFSWPSFMSRMTGNTWTNFGVSGSSAREWVQGGNYSKLSEVQATGNKCQAYVIGLMINDSNPSLHGYTPLGTSADIGTDANTYYAYLYKLINAVNAVNATAPIFVCTCPRTDDTRFANYNVAVRDVVYYCKNTDGKPVYCLDLADDKYNNVQFYKNPEFTADYINGHFTGIGYEFMAECMVHVMSDVINTHTTEFQGVHRIPYDAP